MPFASVRSDCLSSERAFDRAKPITVPDSRRGEKLVNRRSVLKSLCTGGALALAPAKVLSAALEPGGRARIWDIHSHLHAVPGDTPEKRMEVLVRCMDRLGIERLLLSQGYSAYEHPTPDQFREENDRVLRAVMAFPDRAYGSVFISPAYLEFSLQEFDRCVRDGPMVAIGEIEADRRANVAEMDPIVERALALKVPILQHEWLKASGNEPGESTPYDVVELARRHPQLQIVCAHTGGDWERGIRVIRSAKNVYAGMAGFDPTSGAVEMAVRELGAERVIYGSDVGGRSFASQLAKVVGANIPRSAKELILGGNLRRLLVPILQAKGYRV
jgi:predicted TIM-barrel fold metal-dependent hydrolase